MNVKNASAQAESLAPGWSCDQIANEINKPDIFCLQSSCSEVYIEKAFVGSFEAGSRNPLARRAELGETSLSFLVHLTLFFRPHGALFASHRQRVEGSRPKEALS